MSFPDNNRSENFAQLPHRPPHIQEDEPSLLKKMWPSVEYLSTFRDTPIALLSYGAFGATFVATGFPLDTVKTKMQTQRGFTQGKFYPSSSHLFTPLLMICMVLLGISGNALWVAKRILSTEGIRGFFRGCLPPLWGSAIFRCICSSCQSNRLPSYPYYCCLSALALQRSDDSII